MSTSINLEGTQGWAKLFKRCFWSSVLRSQYYWQILNKLGAEWLTDFFKELVNLGWVGSRACWNNTHFSRLLFKFINFVKSIFKKVCNLVLVEPRITLVYSTWSLATELDLKVAPFPLSMVTTALMKWLIYKKPSFQPKKELVLLDSYPVLLDSLVINLRRNHIFVLLLLQVHCSLLWAHQRVVLWALWSSGHILNNLL